jgi:ribosome recycling factor
MEEELDFIYESTKEAMQNAIDRMVNELLKVRAGKASPAMLESVRVDYYGSQTPLKSLANINTPDPTDACDPTIRERIDRGDRKGHHEGQPRFQPAE